VSKPPAKKLKERKLSTANSANASEAKETRQAVVEKPSKRRLSFRPKKRLQPLQSRQTASSESPESSNESETEETETNPSATRAGRAWRDAPEPPKKPKRVCNPISAERTIHVVDVPVATDEHLLLMEQLDLRANNSSTDAAWCLVKAVAMMSSLNNGSFGGLFEMSIASAVSSVCAYRLQESKPAKIIEDRKRILASLRAQYSEVYEQCNALAVLRMNSLHLGDTMGTVKHDPNGRRESLGAAELVYYLTNLVVSTSFNVEALHFTAAMKLVDDTGMYSFSTPLDGLDMRFDLEKVQRGKSYFLKFRIHDDLLRWICFKIGILQPQRDQENL
jgi:hypothetical protein